MISNREEAHATGAFNAPKNIKNGPVVKKLFPKNLGVSNEFCDTVYNVMAENHFMAESSP